MIRQCVAILLVGSFLGLCTPVFAGDPTSIPLALPQRSTGAGTGFGHPHLTSGLHLTSDPSRFAPKIALPNGYAFGLPQSAQPQSSPQPKQLTRTGRILTWVGVGLMGEGALTMGIGAAYNSMNCGPYASCVDNSSVDTYLSIGAVSLAAGAVLFFIGRHKRE
jgi:hypothetical protein